MQLPPDEEIVMVSGTPPIRGRKLRYFEDGNFTARLFDPPKAAIVPAARPHDWSGRRRLDERLRMCADGVASGEEDGGKERRLTPDLNNEDRRAPAEDEVSHTIDADDSDFQETEENGLARARRAMALDMVDEDLLPDF